MAFSRQKISILEDPKQISVVLKSEKQKKKKKKNSLLIFYIFLLSSFCTFSSFHFQFSTFPFTTVLFFFSIFHPFPIFPCLFFHCRSPEISWSEVSGGTLPPCYTTSPGHCPSHCSQNSRKQTLMCNNKLSVIPLL